MGIYTRPVLLENKVHVARVDTFGPIAEANTGINGYYRLMLNPGVGNLDDSNVNKRTRIIVIDRIWGRAGTKSSVNSGATACIAVNTTTTAHSGDIDASAATILARRVTSDVDLYTITNNTDFEFPILTDGTTYAGNTFKLDDPFALYLFTDVAMTALADLSISVAYRIDELA